MDSENVWKGRLEEYKASGIGRKEFCERHGVTENALCYWQKKLSGVDGKFVRVVGEKTALTIELILKSGVVIRISEGVSTQSVKRLVEALNA